MSTGPTMKPLDIFRAELLADPVTCAVYLADALSEGVDAFTLASLALAAGTCIMNQRRHIRLVPLNRGKRKWNSS
jgi:hypothetical protein